MDAKVVQLELTSQQYERLLDFASHRRIEIREAAQVAIAEWLEEQARLERARTLMRELGKGLGEGRALHDVARRHDAYLYAPNQP